MTSPNTATFGPDGTDLFVMWQSAPRHLRHRTIADVPDDQPTEVAAEAPAEQPVPRPGPKPKRKPIWQATRPSAADSPPTEVAGDSELEQLGARIRGMAADLAATTCQWLHLIERFDRENGWAGVGIASCAAWLSWTCSISKSTAREYVRVARSLPQLPLVDAAFAAGRLSYSKVRVLVKVAAEVDEATLLEQAQVQTVSQLESTVRAFRRGDGWSQECRRRASWHWDDDGMLCLSARLPADEGALLLAALEQSRGDLRGADDVPSEAKTTNRSAGSDTDVQPDDGDRSRAQLTGADPVDVARADMLMAVVHRAQAAGRTDSSGDDRHLVVVHTNGREFAQPVTGHLENGPGLEPKAVDRIACDAAWVHVVHDVREGEPLRLGRKTRKISPALRRALRIRDGACVFPGCDRRSHLDAHHALSWSLGGPTDLENLLLVCRFHHMLLHEAGFGVRADTSSAVGRQKGAGVRWEFTDPVGRAVPAVPPAFVPGPDAQPQQHCDPDALLPGWRGEPFQLAETVAVLARNEKPRKAETRIQT